MMKLVIDLEGIAFDEKLFQALKKKHKKDDSCLVLTSASFSHLAKWSDKFRANNGQPTFILNRLQVEDGISAEGLRTALLGNDIDINKVHYYSTNKQSLQHSSEAGFQNCHPFEELFKVIKLKKLHGNNRYILNPSQAAGQGSQGGVTDPLLPENQVSCCSCCVIC